MVQNEREGLGHAVWMARNHFQHEKELFIALGDTVFDMDMAELLRRNTTCLGVKEVADPHEFGVVELDEKGFVKKVIEEPKIPRSNKPTTNFNLPTVCNAWSIMV